MNERDRQAVLFANEAFYAAFAGGDFTQMAALWGTDGIDGRSVPTCIHPGWAPLMGREPVLESWRAILRSPPPVEMRNPTVFTPDGTGETALVICYEVIEGETLVASNLFVRAEDGWRIFHHQAGPCPSAPKAESDDRADSIN